MNNLILIVFLLCSNTIVRIDSANILFFMLVSSYSHRISIWPLVEKLADAGHNITFLQPYIPKNTHPKVFEFHTKEWEYNLHTHAGDVDIQEDFVTKRYVHGKPANFNFVQIFKGIALHKCEQFLNDSEAIKWTDNTNFDIVFIDFLFNDCGLGLAHKFGAKTILIASSPIFYWQYDPYGIPADSSWISDITIGYDYPLTFLERVINTVMIPATYYFRRWFYFPKMEEILRDKLKMPDMPSLDELEQNVSLIFMNAHYGEEEARSLPPFVVSIGGLHCENYTNLAKTDKIDKKILEFIGEGYSGFIFVSFGTLAKASAAPPELQKKLFDAFRASKLRFLWKWEGERPSSMPDNVLTTEWVSQPSILAHPQIKGFITHGGLLSVQEALLFEVPLIVFPLYADQDFNSFRVERTGRGIRLELSTFTSLELQAAISRIVTNQTYYKSNLKKASKVFQDRPVSALNTALWWTEFVLRHEDTSFLKPLSRHQNLIERRLIDVWSFVVLCLMFIIVLLFHVVIFIFKRMYFLVSFLVGNRDAVNTMNTKNENRIKRE